MLDLNSGKIIYLPEEIVNIIADYHDYEKYCKPQHYELLKGVINDIGDIAQILDPIKPCLVRQCWGNLSYQLEDDYEWNIEEESALHDDNINMDSDFYEYLSD